MSASVKLLSSKCLPVLAPASVARQHFLLYAAWAFTGDSTFTSRYNMWINSIYQHDRWLVVDCLSNASRGAM